MKFPQLTVPLAVDVLEDRLEQMIFSGVIRPDIYLPPERKFAEDIGISRTTVQQAISRLKAKGLLSSDGFRHRTSDVITVLLARAFNAIKGKEHIELFNMLEKTAIGMSKMADVKANNTDRARINDAVQSLMQSLGSKKRGQQFLDLYNLMMTVVEASYNFFGIQVVHTLLHGFKEFLEQVLKFISKDIQERSNFEQTLLEFTNPKISLANSMQKLFDLLKSDAHKERISFEFIQIKSDVTKSATNDVFQNLTSLIKSNKFPIGSMLPDTKTLAESLNCTENALKLTLHQLEASGLVTLEKRGRARVLSTLVKDPTESLMEAILRQPFAIEAIFEFRLLLEEWSCDAAARNIDKKGKKNLTSLLTKMTEQLTTDIDAYTHHDINFHKAISKASGNAALNGLLESFWLIIERVTSNWLLDHAKYAGDNSEIHRQHKRIFDAIMIGDGKAAALEMRRHLHYVLDGLKTLQENRRYEKVSELRKSLETKD